jgi:hypothetical protein
MFFSPIENHPDFIKELNVCMAEGRALNTPTNINYLLQDYSTSIEYFDKVDHTSPSINTHVLFFSSV